MTDRQPRENKGIGSAAKEVEHFTKSPFFAYCLFALAIVSLFSEIPLAVRIAIAAIATILVVLRSLRRSIQGRVSKFGGEVLACIFVFFSAVLLVGLPFVVENLAVKWITGRYIEGWGGVFPIAQPFVILLQFAGIFLFWLVIYYIFRFFGRWTKRA
jgi:hypothetical protein